MRRIIGIGNDFRNDDRAGLEVARRMAEARADVIVFDGDLTNLPQVMEGCEEVVIVDAVTSGGEPGTLHLLDVSEQALSPALRFSTHAVGLGDVLELARLTGSLPSKITVVGIEVADCGFGTELSEPVAATIERITGDAKPGLFTDPFADEAEVHRA